MMHIALVFDANIDYNRFAVVLVDSIRRTTDSQVFFHFLVDRRNCRQDFIRLLEKLVERSGNYSEVIDVGQKIDKRFKDAKHWQHVSNIAYARFLIPELVDVNERVIYMDCDIVVRRDLEQTLYNEKIGDKPIAGVLDKWLTCSTDGTVSDNQIKEMTRLRNVFGISAPARTPVFHDGLIVFERSRMPSRTWVADKIAESVTKNGNRELFSDMGAFDDAFAKHCFMLPFKYMINMTTLINNTDEGVKSIESLYGLDLVGKSAVKGVPFVPYKSIIERVMTDAVLYHYTGFKDRFFFSETVSPVSEDLTMRYESAVRYAKS